MKGLADVQQGGIVQSPGFVADDGQATATRSLFSGLADAAKGMRRQLQPMLDQQAEQQASEDIIEATRAREDGRTAIDVPLRRTLTRQDQVYNGVVQAGVMATAKADYADEITRLSKEFEFDPLGYQKAADGFIEGYASKLGERDFDLSTMLALEQDARNSFAAEGARIETNTRNLQTRETQDALERRFAQISAEVATLLERDGLDAAFGESYTKLEDEAVDITELLVDNPVYGWSGEKGAEALDGLMNQSTEILATQGLEAEYYREGGGAIAALKFIDGAVDSMVLDQGERIGARSRLQQRLSILQQMTALEDAELRAQGEERDVALETASLAFEAELLQRMGSGERPSQRDIGRGRLLVEAGALKPARLSVYVNAATSTDSTQNDEIVLASLFDYARTPGVTRDDVEQVTIEAMGNVKVTASERERVLRAYDQQTDDRLDVGTDMLNGYFATGFMDIDSGAVKSAKAAADLELQNWFENNPEATSEQMASRAKRLAVEAGRRMPRPPMPQIPGHRSPPVVSIENVETWANQARLGAFEALQDDPAEFNRVMRQIDEQEAWIRERQRAQQENLSGSE